MFTLPDLPYAYDALEPYIDEQTMRLHHGKHHQTYVDKLNTALEGTEFTEKSIEEIMQKLAIILSASRPSGSAGPLGVINSQNKL